MNTCFESNVIGNSCVRASSNAPVVSVSKKRYPHYLVLVGPGPYFSLIHKINRTKINYYKCLKESSNKTYFRYNGFARGLKFYMKEERITKLISHDVSRQTFISINRLLHFCTNPKHKMKPSIMCHTNPMGTRERQ